MPKVVPVLTTDRTRSRISGDTSCPTASLYGAHDQPALVQAFVNPRNITSGHNVLGAGASGWLSGRGFLAAEATWRRLIAFREGLRGLLILHNREPGADKTGAADIEELNGLAGSAALRVSFDLEGEPRLRPAAAGVDGAMGALLAAAVRAADEGTWGRLKACRNEGCRWAFYDISKNCSGSWCTMDVCGSRAKMRAYRQRRSL